MYEFDILELRNEEINAKRVVTVAERMPWPLRCRCSPQTNWADKPAGKLMLRLNLKMAEIVVNITVCQMPGGKHYKWMKYLVFFVLVTDLSFLTEGGLAPMQGEANEHLRKVQY